ncbi:PabB [uncultured Desulfobacterium sp.]|uniref:aminodeoxychorismate synthase n=1 Tax=uncultured Desulfobacterium sp. TaxID=201089 RepID=A0A445N0M6_9BACT|nr:PabB [uncultured Desulfobacterium sp.]
MDEIKSLTGDISNIHVQEIILHEPFIDIAERFSSETGTVALISGGDLDCARHHILAIRPWLTFRGRGHDLTITVGDHVIEIKADPFDILRALLNDFQCNSRNITCEQPLPIAAGLFGYLSYDLKDNLEQLPRTTVDDLCLPHICLFAPSVVVIHDKLTEKTSLSVIKRMLPGRKSDLDDEIEAFQRTINSPVPGQRQYRGRAEGFKSNIERVAYLEALEKIKEYILSGHVYQVNMSQRFQMDFDGDPYNLFKSLYSNNPAPFFAFIQAGDHQIVSTSPERFILRAGDRVETRPIKGTRPRGKTPAEDDRLRTELLESRKDDAELSMIVDLLRNDIGKVCASGSVRVAEHKRLEAYQNVYHLISVVEGSLDRGRDSVDLIRAIFPGGSITGCPKIRAMEIIDELEPNSRHVYTGAIGYISFHDTIDLSIAIRTATILNGKAVYSAGGGIVIDSIAEDEFDETLHKGRTLMEVFKGDDKGSKDMSFAWINGALRPIDQVAIPVTDQGVQYGYGFFETIRVGSSGVCYLDRHIERFNRAWRGLFFSNPPDLTWDVIIDQVIEANHLNGKTAAVKIMATRGDRDLPPFNNSIIVMARPYVHRLTAMEKPGLNLVTYPEPRQTPLADHKTLNYLYYFLAGRWAKDNGADEALIMNPDGTVSETNTGNILIIKGRTVTVPISPHVLPGIMEAVICRLLSEWGYEIIKKTVIAEDIFRTDQVLITNSLIGAVPALVLDDKRLSSSNLWQRINQEVI